MFDLVSIILFLIPAYVANSTPVVFGGGTPLDLNKKWSDGRYIFGKNKTIKGFISGVFGGTIVGLIISYFVLLPYFNNLIFQISGFFLLSLGTMIGDALGSFIKRRSNVTEGKPFLLDSFLFIIVALLLSVPFLNKAFYTLENLIFILILTLILHPLTNKLANMAGIKRVPW